MNDLQRITQEQAHEILTDLFENMLMDEFIKLEKDYDKLDQVLEKFSQQNIVKTSPS